MNVCTAVGESNGELRVSMNGHRYAIISKAISSALFTHLLEHAQINKDMSEPSLDDYDLIPIQQIPITGSYTQDKINRFNTCGSCNFDPNIKYLHTHTLSYCLVIFEVT